MMGFLLQLIGVLVGAVIYVLPSIIAAKRLHHRRRVIYAVNLLLGWSVVGWIVALVWALSGVNRATRALDDYFQ